MPPLSCLRILLVLLGLSLPAIVAAQSTRSAKLQVMVVGSDHLTQLYNKQPASDVLGPKRQAELAQVRAQLAQFRPDAILVEAEPGEQGRLDSLYTLYQQGLLQLGQLPNARHELYQIGFALAKQLQLPSPKAADYYRVTSQSLLNTGTNVDAYQRELKLLQTTARPLKALVQHDSLSLYDYLALINQPALVALVHRMQFNTPALVMNGTFAADATNTAEVGKVDTEYIGAHFITLYYNRNLKIYSNILRVQQQSHAQRLLVLFGMAHVGVLEELLAANPAYHVVHAAHYLTTNKAKLLRLDKKAEQ